MLSKGRVHELSTDGVRRRSNPFPAPLARLRAGPVWDGDEVDAWFNARQQRREAEAQGRAARLRAVEERLAAEPPSDVLAAAAEAHTDDWMETLRRIAAG